MKTQTAIHIAEHLWADTVQPGSLFDQFVKKVPEMEKLTKEGKTKELNDMVSDIKQEIVARWANVIMEVEKHAT